MYKLSTAMIALATLGQCAYVTINYWPDTTDCTGRMETLEVNGESCNTGNVIHSYAVTACSGADELFIYVDGSACVGDVAGYVSDVCGSENLNVCKSAPNGGGSVFVDSVGG